MDDESCNEYTWKYLINDNNQNSMLPEKYKYLSDNYVLIASITNEKSKKSEYSVDDDYLLSVMDNMKMNIRGNRKKHHGSLGEYYGFGIVAKYSMNSKSSIGEFSKKQVMTNDLTYIHSIQYPFYSMIY